MTSTSAALQHIRVCDLSGLVAGAGATKILAAFGADVIRVEDPTNNGRWDISREMAPFVDERRGHNLGGVFNNYHAQKRGVTLNLRTERARELLTKLITVSDVVTENFGAGVMDRLGFAYEDLKQIKPDIVYVSNCGFGHSGPYVNYKTFGPIVQAMSGLTATSGLPDMPPAGWGYSFMDHGAAYFMAMAIMLALHHREVTGEGQWVDMASTEAGVAHAGPVLLDYTVNGRKLRRGGMPHSNRSQHPRMAPHNIYACAGDDNWIAVSVRNDADWKQLGTVVAEPWTQDPKFAMLDDRLANEDELDRLMESWTRQRGHFEAQHELRAGGVIAEAVARPADRMDNDANTAAWGLWPTAQHTEIGRVHVDGLPVHMSKTDWHIDTGGPCLGEHTDEVLTELLEVEPSELPKLREERVI